MDAGMCLGEFEPYTPVFPENTLGSELRSEVTCQHVGTIYDARFQTTAKSKSLNFCTVFLCPSVCYFLFKHLSAFPEQVLVNSIFLSDSI